MPNFPKPSGDLPEVLSPLNLRHYWLIAYWVYFRPTAFHRYLYQASPDVYQLRGYQKFVQTWRIRAYRNIYLMLPLAIVLMALLVGLVLFLYKSITVVNNTAWVNAIAVSPNGQIAVTASGDRALKVKVPSADSSLKVWNLQWGSQMHTLIGHEHGVTDVAITPDGHKAISASRDRTLKVWDIRRGTQLHELKGHKEWVSRVVITADGHRAISSSGDKTLMVWDIDQGTPLQTLTGHNDVIWTVAVTPDGQRAISASADRTLKVWDIEQGKELYTLTGHNNSVTDVVVSPDGKQAVSASADRTLKVWDIQQGKLLNTLTGHQGWVTSVAMAPDGKQAVSASSDQTMKVWDLGSAIALHTFAGHHAWVTAIAVLPKTARLISASFEGPPKLWSLNRGLEQPMLGVIGTGIGMNLAFATALAFMVLAGAVSLAIFLAISVIALGIIGNITASVLIGLIGSLGFCIGFLMADRIAADPMLEEVYHARNISITLTIISGILFGLLVGVSFALSSRTATGVFASIVFILVLGISVGIVVACVVTEALSFNGRLRPGIRAGEAVSITFNLLVAIGALRLLIYPIQFVMALFSRLRGKWHPAAWDELLVLPVPRTQAFLQSHLQASEHEGLRLVADVARNPFQRPWAQRALQTHLHKVSAPLHFLYDLLTSEAFNTYLLAPVRRVDWQLMPTTRQVLLGELAHQRVDGSGAGINQIAENLVWGLTRFLRNRQRSPLTRFAGLIYELTYTKTFEAEGFNLFALEKSYAGLSQYPGGVEIADSFEALATFLTYDHLSDLAGARDMVSWLSVQEFSIRPTVLSALLRLGDIGTKVKAYQAASTTVEQLATLAQITSALEILDEDVVAQVLVPEQVILRRIIRQWRWLVSQASANQPKLF